MATPRAFITREFLERVRVDGELEAAADRLAGSNAAPEPLPDMSTWALVCEEVVDTEYEPEHYERVAAELLRRGISRPELREMRVFAWETAGWLNYEQMLWDWSSLDERDIRKAIRWQRRESEIDEEEQARRLAYLERYTGTRR